MAYVTNRSPETFTDMFCGIGVFHVAATQLGLQCVFACDIDKEAKRAYHDNFGSQPSVDITAIQPEAIPDHNIVACWVPVPTV